jgi:hypothetical protein
MEDTLKKILKYNSSMCNENYDGDANIYPYLYFIFWRVRLRVQPSAHIQGY